MLYDGETYIQLSWKHRRNRIEPEQRLEKEYRMAHTIESLIGMIPKTLPGDKAKRADTIVQLNVTGSQAGQWNVVVKDGKVNVAKGTHAAPEITVTADTADVLAVADGKLDPTQAFLQGKAKVKGDMSEAMELVKVFMPN